MSKELILKGKEELVFRSYEERALEAGEVRAKAVMSAVSHGTELSLYRGVSPFQDKQFDMEKHIFTPDEAETLYPATLGYEWVGLVTECGRKVTMFKEGDIVHLPMPHRESQIFNPAGTPQLGLTQPLPGGMEPRHALFVRTTGIALQAVHDAKIKVGDHVVLFGLGSLGLIALQLILLSGAGTVAVVDPNPERRKMAQNLGADLVWDPTTMDPGKSSRVNGPGADISIEFSGNYPALQQAIRCVRPGGQVVAAGFYQGDGCALNLGEEWLHNRVSMVASMGGWGNAHRNAPLWDRPRIRKTSISLLASGKISVDPLLTHSYPFSRAPEAFGFLHKNPQGAMKIILNFS